MQFGRSFEWSKQPCIEGYEWALPHYHAQHSAQWSALQIDPFIHLQNQSLNIIIASRQCIKRPRTHIQQ